MPVLGHRNGVLIDFRRDQYISCCNPLNVAGFGWNRSILKLRLVVYIITTAAQWLLYIPPGLTHKFHVLPTQCILYFVWIWEQTAIISQYSINWLVFITETEYMKVRAHFVFLQLNNFQSDTDRKPTHCFIFSCLFEEQLKMLEAI
jgi:hypothetical protein